MAYSNVGTSAATDFGVPFVAGIVISLDFDQDHLKIVEDFLLRRGHHPFLFQMIFFLVLKSFHHLVVAILRFQIRQSFLKLNGIYN